MRRERATLSTTDYHLHAGNIGISLQALLEKYSEDDILNYFGRPEVSLVFTRQPLSRPEAPPPHLDPPIPLAYYLKDTDPSFNESPLHVEIMDLGNGQPNVSSYAPFRLPPNASNRMSAAMSDEPPRPSCTPAAYVPNWAYAVPAISRTTADAEWKRRLDHYAGSLTAADDVAEFGVLLRTMLEINASARPTALEVLRHPWFVDC
ncbi:uncharacterized protein FIBRA_02380 [Fibroporia radiculosa]|uniref:Protein kinase domain-containing protein n=1 Tax=Fibroporia radiculosa TaxID=599839 RepID=J4GMU4_9APHY|nr:uncharacterized protein FIBRA_02380 [Fibroporia radiculosa]CCM00350.1 predicted protein [Fibroporia radiculosa]